MALKISLSDARNFKKLIEDGMTIRAVAKRVPCKDETLVKSLRRHGLIVSRDVSSPMRSLLNDRKIVNEYLLGKSELAIARSLGCSRGPIRKILLKHRVIIRNSSEANVIRMSRLSVAERMELVTAAHAARRGSKDKRISRIQRSASRESRGIGIGPGEIEILGALRSRGYEAAHQKSIDVYNVDVVFGSVAVEVKFGAHGRLGTNITMKRIKKLRESGLKTAVVIIADVHGIRFGLDEVISLLECVDRRPSGSRKYWVIRSGLQTSTIPKKNLDNGTAIQPPKEFVTSVREVDF